MNVETTISGMVANYYSADVGMAQKVLYILIILYDYVHFPRYTGHQVKSKVSE